LFVFSIDGVDEENEIIYFSGNKGNHTQRHLFMTSFSADNPTPGKLSLRTSGKCRKMMEGDKYCI
jgi:hypothetical protein